MILPVTAYGHPVLRKRAQEIDQNYEGLEELVDNMFETMYQSRGVGLAAPQVNHSIRLFIVDARIYAKENPESKNFIKVFLNPVKLNSNGEEWTMEEGCLSIPFIYEEVNRTEGIRLKYYDQNWEMHDENFTGMPGRIIHHEYDHLEGVLFTDHLSNLKKTMLKGKLKDIAYGRINPGYRMIYPKLKKEKLKPL